MEGGAGKKERHGWRVGDVFFMKLLLFCRAENQILKNHNKSKVYQDASFIFYALLVSCLICL